MTENDIFDAESEMEAKKAPDNEGADFADHIEEELRLRIAELEALLSQREEKRERARAEREDFMRVFPEANPDALPDEVNAQRESGIPLAAAYALYERVKQNELRAAEEANRKNSISVPSSVSGGFGEAFFSANEVKNMSSEQVRKNLSGILRSMKHWGR